MDKLIVFRLATGQGINMLEHNIQRNAGVATAMKVMELILVDATCRVRVIQQKFVETRCAILSTSQLLL